jgi:hypothetical protein
MDMKEHIYADDPKVGHPDVRTALAGVNYFFLGNGLIHAAVQIAPRGEGTPLGLLVMHPELFGPKRAALTCHQTNGLRGTMVRLRVGDSVCRPKGADVEATWEEIDGVPTVRVSWQTGTHRVVERFFCPNRTTPRICRTITVERSAASEDDVSLLLGESDTDGRTLGPSVDSSASATLIYRIVRDDGQPIVLSRWEQEATPAEEAVEYWGGLNSCTTGDAALDHLFDTARRQLPTAIDASGRMDGSIWQYNLEWVRDQAHVAEALVRLGDYELARTMLARLLDEFVSEDGDVIDSGRHREPIEVELDQNGELLTALRTYIDWSGDLELVRARWTKVEALVAFPLKECFRHEESGLLHNAREYWERHAGHGIQDGCELMHQFFVAMGLENAVYLSDVSGNDPSRGKWSSAAAALRYAFLENPKYRLVENGHFIKRRGLDGLWQEAIRRSEECILPPEIPLMEAGPRYLDPDTSSVLPIVYSFIDPSSELAKNTIAQMDELWNQRWDTGGYGRYNADSEADSPGAWPFASLFVARACVEAGDDANVWRILRWLAAAPGNVAGSWFEFFGDRIAPPYAQVGIVPWTWAEMISLYVHHLLGVRPDLQGVTLRPHLLDGLERMDASVRVHGRQVKLQVMTAASHADRGALIGERRIEWTDRGVRLPLPESDVEVTVFC